MKRAWDRVGWGGRQWMLWILIGGLFLGCAIHEVSWRETGYVSMPVATNEVGESCKAVSLSLDDEADVDAGIGVFCGAWEEPSAHVYRVKSQKDVDRFLEEGWWRAQLEMTANCGPPIPTSILDGVEAIALDCRFRAGGWPYHAIVARIGEEVYLAESIPGTYAVTERAIGLLSGRIEPTETIEKGAASQEIQRLENRLSGEYYSGSDIQRYQNLLKLAQYYNFQGNFPEAERRYREALALQNKVLSEDFANQGFLTMHVALEASNQERFKVADALFQQAESLMPYSLEPTDEARLISYRAINAANQRRDEEALELARTATQLRRDLAERYGYRAATDTRFDEQSGSRLSPSTYLVATSSMNPRAATALGDVVQSRFLEAAMLVEMGNRTEAAEALRDIQWLMENEPRVPRQWLPQIFLLQGRVAEIDGDLNRAERFILEAIDIQRMLFSDSRTEGLAHVALGRIRSQQGRSAEAFQAYRTGIDILERVGGGIHSDDAAAFLETGLEQLENQAANRDEILNEMFLVFQMVRGSIAAQTMALTTARLAASEQEIGTLIRDLQDARYNRDQLREDLTLAQADPQVLATQVQDLEAQWQDVSRRVASLERAVQAASPRYNQLVDTPVAISDVVDVLLPGEMVVQILLGTEKSFGLLIDAEGALPFAIDLNESEAKRYVGMLREPVEADEILRFPVTQAYELYQRLFGPVQEHIAKAGHLIIVPSKSLLSLPLGVLVTQEPEWITGGDYSGVAWMANRHALTLAPSVQSFVNLRKGRPSQAASMFAGFGDFVPLGEPDVMMKEMNLPPACRPEVDLLANAAPLPETAVELQQVAQVLNAPQSAVFLGSAFSESAVREAGLENFHVVFFATHGLLPHELNCFPEPALLVSRPSTDATMSDGLLTASEIGDLSLDADLVVLSACNTGGPGMETGGEALSGLARAFFYAGARSLLVTHWEIPDKPTLDLLSSTFIHFANENMTLAEAVGKAQGALIQNPAFSHPLAWGGFSVVGDGGVRLGRSNYAQK
jgi:CHAT domain-containing protein